MPPLARQVVEIPVVKGMDQGVDPRILGNDSWARLENIVTDQQGAGHKRPGYGPLPTTVRLGSFPARIQWMDVRQQELLIRGRPAVAAGPFDLSLDREWSWAPGLQLWSEVDYVTTCSTSARVVTSTTDGACLPCVAVTSDGCEVWSWLIPNGVAPGASGPVLLARDTQTGATLRPETKLALAWVQSKSVSVSGVAILLGMAAAGATLDAATYTPASDSTTLFGPLHALGRKGVWDACNVGAGRFVVVNCGPGPNQLRITTHNAALGTIDTNTVVTAFPIYHVSVAFAPGVGFKVVYSTNNAGAFDVTATMFLDVAGLPQAYITAVAGPIPALDYLATGVTPAGESVAVWQESTLLPTTQVKSQQLDTAGALSGVLLVTANTLLRSKPFHALNRLYCIASPFFSAVVPLPGTQATNSFTLDLLMAPEPMASRGWASEGIFGVLCATRIFLQQNAILQVPMFPEVPALSSTAALAPVEKQRSITAGFGAAFEGSSSYAVGVTLDFAEQQSACPLGAENSYCLARSGAQVGWYDGEQDVELSFCQRPTLFGPVVIAAVVPPPGIGPIPAPGGVYLYKAVYEWIDAQGNLHQSETSTPLKVTLAPGAGYTVAFNVANLGTTRKGRPTQGDERQVQVALFRTLLSGQIYFRLTPPNGGLVNDTTVSSQAYTDTTPDADLTSNAYGQIYTTGEILDNRPLPGSRCVTAWNNRLWSASADDGKTLWFSKLGVVGEAPGFSEALTLRVDDAVDSVVAFGVMDDKLIVFTGSRIYYVSGDGPNDTGAGGTFNGPVRIASDGGCIDARSVVSYPGGVFYASPSGLFEVSRSLQVSAKGLPVLTETTGCEYLSAWLDAVNKRILWLVTGGTDAVYAGPRVLVYDYAFDVWSLWIPYAGGRVDSSSPDPNLSAQCVWSSVHMWSSLSLVGQQSAGATPWLDMTGAYFRGSYTSPWVKLSGVAGYARAYRVTLTGKSFSNHTVNMRVFTDYDDSVLRQSRAWISTTLQNAPQVERVQLHLEAQLCTAVKIEIFDSAPAIDSGSGPIGGFDLASLAFEVGVKGGSPRLPSTNRG